MRRMVLCTVISLCLVFSLTPWEVNAVEDDSKYLLFDNTALAGESYIIKNLTVPRKTFCPLHCHLDSTCSHFSQHVDDATGCTLYSSIDRANIQTVAGIQSSMKLNPSGTNSKDFIKLLNPSESNGVNTVKWRTAVNNLDDNLVMPAVGAAQSCYEICMFMTEDKCYVFSYVPSSQLCVIPDPDGELDYVKRGNLVDESVTGGEFYLYQMPSVKTAYSANMDDLDYFAATNTHFYLGDSVTDVQNYKIDTVLSAADCYKICLMSNQGTCNVFSYAPDETSCYIPTDDGTLSIAKLKTVVPSTYNTYLYFFASSIYNSEPLVDDKYTTAVGMMYHKGATVDEAGANLRILGLTGAVDCYRICLAVNAGRCLLFTYSIGDADCIIPYDDGTLALKSITRTVSGNYISYLFFTPSLADPSATKYSDTIPTALMDSEDTLYYLGDSATDIDDNIRIDNGVDSALDCYRLCLMINNRRCMVFSFDDVALICNVPYDDGTLDVNELKFSKTPDFVSHILFYTESVHIDEILTSDEYAVAQNEVFFVGDSQTDGVENFIVGGYDNAQDCYITCVDRLQDRCISFSFSSDAHQCIIPNDSGDLTLRTLKRVAAANYVTYLFFTPAADGTGTSYHEDLPATAMISLSVRYHLGTGATDVDNNILTTGVSNTTNCYRLCLMINNGRCMVFSYDSGNKVCNIPYDNGDLDFNQLLYTQTSDFTSYSYYYIADGYMDEKMDSTEYVTASGEIYYSGGSSTDSNNNFIVVGIDEEADCYITCLSTHSGRCLSFSYSPSEDKCIIPNDSGTLSIRDLGSVSAGGYTTYLYFTPSPSNVADVDYTNVLPATYMTTSNMLYYLGSSTTDPDSNLQISVVDSHVDCYRVCLMINNGHCKVYSYHETSDICQVPYDNEYTGAANALTFDSLLYSYTPDYTSNIFFYSDSAYKDNVLEAGKYTVANGEIYHLGDGTNDKINNFIIGGIENVDDCYVACLDHNNGRCLSLSYKEVPGAADNCIIPNDAAGDLKLRTLTRVGDTAYITYLFFTPSLVDPLAKDFAEAIPSQLMNTVGIQYYLGSTGPTDIDNNLQVAGVATTLDCYRVCLMINDGICSIYSYSGGSDICIVPYDDGTLTWNQLTFVANSDYTSSIFFYSDSPYFTDGLVTDMYATANDEVYHQGTLTTDTGNNFIFGGVADVDHCYVACLDYLEGRCLTFSYKHDPSTFGHCIIPNGNTATLRSMTRSSSGGYKAYLMFRPDITDTINTQFDHSLPTNYMDSANMLFYLGTVGSTDIDNNIQVTGVTGDLQCYRICLMINNGICNVYSLSGNICVVPYDDGALSIEGLTDVYTVGYTSNIYFYSNYAHFGESIDVEEHTTVDNEIFYLGNDYTDTVANLIFGGIDSKDDCYVACLEHNNDRCFSFSYQVVSGGSDNCIIPDDHSGTMKLEDLQRTGMTGYSTYLTFTPHLSDGDAIEYSDALPTYRIVSTGVLFYLGESSTDSANYQATGVDSDEDCYRLCLMINNRLCKVYSFSSTHSICHVPKNSGSMTIEDLSYDLNSDYTGDVFFYSDSGHMSEILEADEYTISTNMVYHQGSVTTDVNGNHVFESATNLVFGGLVNMLDCYKLCLGYHSGRCLTFSYKYTTEKYGECVIPDDNTVTLRQLTKTSSTGYTAYLVFRPDVTDSVGAAYDDILPAIYINSANIIFHLGGGPTETASNIQVTGVDSDVDCYRVCLMINNMRCMIYSFSANDDICIVPYDDGYINEASELSINSLAYYVSIGYQSNMFFYSTSDYKAEALTTGEFTTVNGEILYMGDNSGDTVNNFIFGGIDNKDDCYVACLEHNGGRCLSFSFKPATSTPGHCIIPNDPSGALELGNLKRIAASDYVTYLIFNPYYPGVVVTPATFTDNLPTSHMDSADIVFYMGTSSDAAENFRVTGVTSAVDCYRVCLMLHGGTCSIFSFSSTTCHIPIDDGDMAITELSTVHEAGFTSYIFYYSTSDYKDETLTAGEYTTVTNEILHLGTPSTDTVANLIFSGIDSKDDCYVACLEKNNGHCLTFSYKVVSSGPDECLIPIDTSGTTKLSGFTRFDSTGYIAYLMFTPDTVDNLADVYTDAVPTSHMDSTDIVFYMGDSSTAAENFRVTGVASAVDCYRVCLMINDRRCMVYSYSSTTCHIPIDDGDMAITEPSTVYEASSTSYIFYYTTSDYKDETLTTGEYTTVTNEILHLGTPSTDAVANLIFSGIDSKDDCYVACLEKNNGHCLTFSYKVVSSGPDECLIPIDTSGTTKLSGFTRFDSGGYIAYLMFTPNTVNNLADVYTDAVPTSHMDSTDIVFYMGDSSTAAENFRVTGVASAVDCYRVCLMINDRRCMVYSYSSTTCHIPIDDGDMAITEPSTVYEASSTSYIFYYTTSDYKDETLTTGEYTTVTNEILHLGTPSTDAVANLIFSGIDSKDDCYVACLEKNNGHCLTFSYKVVSSGPDECLIPIDTSGTTKLSGFTRFDSGGYIAYLMFTPNTVNNLADVYTDAVPTSHMDSTDIVFYMGDSSTATENFRVTGVANADDCYRVCLMINDRRCMVYSYSSTTCHIPIDDGDMAITEPSKVYEAESTSYIFYYSTSDYKDETLTAGEYTTVTNEILHLGTPSTDTVANLIFSGIDSKDDCYVACLEKNNGHCLTFSYKVVSSGPDECLIPIDTSGTTKLSGFTRFDSTGYIAYLMFTPNTVDNLADVYTDAVPTSHMDSTDIVFYMGASSTAAENFRVTGVANAVDCYRVCLMINDRRCMVYSYSSTICHIPIDDGDMAITEPSKVYEAGSTSYIFYYSTSDYKDKTLTIGEYTTVTSEILHLGTTSADTVANLIFSGIDSKDDCYVACLEKNNGHCLTFSYKVVSSGPDECVIPIDTSGTTKLSGFTRFDSTEYIAYLMFTPDTVDNLADVYTDTVPTSHMDSTDIVFYMGDSSTATENFRVTGVTSADDCYRVCLMINDRRCMVYSYSSTICHIPIDDGDMAITEPSTVYEATSTSYIFYYSTSDYKDETLTTGEYTTVTDEILHLGTPSTDTVANLIFSGIDSKDDCYVACLEKNNGHCLTFSYKVVSSGPDGCLIPIDTSGTTKLSGFTRFDSTGYIAYLMFTPNTVDNLADVYTDAVPTSHMDSTDIVFYMGDSSTATENFRVTGVANAVDCYRVCLMINDRRCMVYSYSSTICHIPIDDGDMAITEPSTVYEAGSTSYIFYYSTSDYKDETLTAGEYTTVTNEILHLGTPSTDAVANLIFSGIDSKDDCYVACLEKNNGHCLTFSYKIVSSGPDECLIPIDTSGTTKLSGFTRFDSSGYIAYLMFTPDTVDNLADAYDDTLPTDSMDSSNSIHYLGASTTATENYRVTGVASAEDCYRVCLMINDRRCMVFSFSSTTCHIPLDDGTVAITDLLFTGEASTTSYLFYYTSSSYKTNTLAAGDYAVANGEIYHNGVAPPSTSSNLIFGGIDSFTDCYVACLDHLTGRCITFSYKYTTEDSGTCVIPDGNTKVLSDFTRTDSTGYTVYLIYTPNVDDASATAYDDALPTNFLSSSDVLFYLGTGPADGDDNLKVTGVTSAESCYRVCLMINDRVCKVFSFSSDDSVCNAPVHTSTLTILDLNHQYESGYTATFYFYSASSYLGKTLPSTDYTYSKDEIYHLGTGVDDDVANYIVSGIGSILDCYIVCLEQNGGHCLTFSYRDASDSVNICLVPLDSAHTQTLKDFTRTSTTGYNAYIVFTPNVEDISADAYALSLPSTATESSHTIVYLGSNQDDVDNNIKVTGVSSAEHCYRICHMINLGHCRTFSFSLPTTTCYASYHTSTQADRQFGYTGSTDYTTYRYFYVGSNYYTQTLDSDKYATTSDQYYYRGSGTWDNSKNLVFGGIDDAVDCYRACLETNNGRCLVFSFKYTLADSGRCLIPRGTGVTLPNYKLGKNKSGYTVYFFFKPHVTSDSATRYDDDLPTSETDSANVLYYLGASSTSTSDNFIATGVDSKLKCYRLCLMANLGTCKIFSWSSGTTTCNAPLHTSSNVITDYSVSTTDGYSSYQYYYAGTTYFEQTMAADDYTQSNDQYFYKGTGIDDAENVIVLGFDNAADCYMACLTQNSGRCLSFSFSTTTTQCVIPKDDTADLAFTDLTRADAAGFITYIFFKPSLSDNVGAYTDTLPFEVLMTAGVVYYIGTGIDDSGNNIKMEGVDSALYCYRVCLMINDGDCNMFSYSSAKTCVVPYHTSSLVYADLSYADSSTYAGYLYFYTGSSHFSQSITSSDYTVATTEIFYAGASYTTVADNYRMDGLTDLQDCYRTCLEINSGRCLVFSYSSSTKLCYFPLDSGSLTLSSLSHDAVSDYTTYFVYDPKPSGGGDVDYSAAPSSSDYTEAPSQLIYSGGSNSDSSNFIASGVGSHEDCYKLCEMYAGESGSCYAYSYGSSTCRFPKGITTMTGLSMESNSNYKTYAMYTPSSQSGNFQSNSWSDLTDLRIIDGQTGSMFDIYFQSVATKSDCYKLCLSTFTTCQTFSYRSTAQECYITDANFHDDWTTVVHDTDSQAYFLKDSSKYKLLTKHVEYHGYSPYDAYSTTGSYHDAADSAAMAFSDTDSSFTYLKSRLIDYWADLSSKSTVRVELYDTSGNFLKYIEYDAGSTTKTSWFGSSDYSSSSYTDLNSESQNIWQMGGTGHTDFTFYISRNHGGCTADSGWLFVQAAANVGCSEWANAGSSTPMFLYASGSTYVNWSSGKSHFAVLVVKMSFN